MTSPLDTLPCDIRTLIVTYVTGNNLGEAIQNIKKFYVASSQSRSSILINQAILKHLMQKFDYEFTEGNSLQKVVNNLNTFPVFRNPEMLQWIEQEKKRLDDENALRAATYAGDIYKVHELINKKVNIDARTQHTPLINALQARCAKIVEMLLEHGADPNLPAGGPRGIGMTPLIEAIRFNNNPSILELLIIKGARVNDKNALGETALIYVLTGPRTSELEKHYIKILLAAGADPNRIDASYNSVLTNLLLYYTGTEIQDDILTMLLSKGADPNVGKAIHYDYSDPRAPTTRKISALNYARQVLRNEDLANRLILYGAK